MEEIIIPSEYMVQEEGTSDGTQIKYFYKDKWYKVDRYGGEGEVEELTSQLLQVCGLPEKEYVSYDQILINGEKGCVSDNFLQEGESFITFYRLYHNIYGKDLAAVTSKMDYDDAIEYVLAFVKKETGLDIKKYLANTLLLDSIILNGDRHFNNLGVVFDGVKYHEAPIFDNGKSLFVGNGKYNPDKSIADNKKNAFAKAFGGSFKLNESYLKGYQTFEADKEKIIDELSLSEGVDGPRTRLYRLLCD